MREPKNTKPHDTLARAPHDTLAARGAQTRATNDARAAVRAPGAAPPAYRPQPTPKCLQMKASPARKQHEGLAPRNPNAQASTPPSARATVAQRKPEPRPAPPKHAPEVVRPKRAGVVQPKCSGVVQRKQSGVVQAIKFYPNLHPGAVERVEPNSLFRLENFTDQYRLRRVGTHGAYVPNQQYNFVRTSAGEMLLHNRYRHPSIAEGRQVLYAGEVFFNNGRLEWWSNGSGHYQPDSQDAGQAALPMDSFYTYQQVIKGEHKQKGRRG